MRPILISVCTLLALACTREQSRPAKEAVAEVKAAAVEAQQAAQQAAAEADHAVTGAAEAVQHGVATAAETTRAGAESVARGVHELGEGGVVTGRVNSFSLSQLALHPEGKGPAELRVDGRTRYLLRGDALSQGGLPAGTRVRATYVVEARLPVATEVEVLTQ